MKSLFPICVVFALSFATAACMGSPGSSATVRPVASPTPSVALAGREVTSEPSASPSAEIAPSASPTAAPTPSGTTTVRAYFILDGPVGNAGLVPVLREIPATPAIAGAAMAALLEGPDGAERDASPPISSEVPTGTELLDLSIEDGVATVDLSGEFDSGGTSASHISRLAQVVYTLTQFPSVKSVEIRVDGRPVTAFGSDGVVLDGPIGRADLVDVEPFQSMLEGALPAIFVDGPAWGAALGNPGRVTGTANTYEAWLMVSLYDASGRGLDETPVQATCGTGCRGTFDVTLAYTVSKAQWGTLRVLDGDESGETEGVIREYPVWLTPGLPEDAPTTCGC
jgi:germination protein M